MADLINIIAKTALGSGTALAALNFSIRITLSLAGLYTVLAFGPVDSVRTVYNQIVGNTPALKRSLVSYIREDIKEKNPGFTDIQVDSVLAKEIRYNFHKEDEERINPDYTKTHRLWDASEEHADNLYQRWIWTSLNSR